MSVSKKYRVAILGYTGETGKAAVSQAMAAHRLGSESLERTHPDYLVSLCSRPNDAFPERALGTAVDLGAAIDTPSGHDNLLQLLLEDTPDCLANLASPGRTVAAHDQVTRSRSYLAASTFKSNEAVVMKIKAGAILNALLGPASETPRPRTKVYPDFRSENSELVLFLSEAIKTKHKKEFLYADISNPEDVKTLKDILLSEIEAFFSGDRKIDPKDAVTILIRDNLEKLQAKELGAGDLEKFVPLVLSVVNPVGPALLNMHQLGIPANKLLGLSGIVDESRFREAAGAWINEGSNHMNNGDESYEVIPTSRIDVRIFGDHGKGMVIEAFVKDEDESIPFVDFISRAEIWSQIKANQHLMSKVSEFANGTAETVTAQDVLDFIIHDTMNLASLVTAKQGHAPVLNAPDKLWETIMALTEKSAQRDVRLHAIIENDQTRNMYGFDFDFPVACGVNVLVGNGGWCVTGHPLTGNNTEKLALTAANQAAVSLISVIAQKITDFGNHKTFNFDGNTITIPCVEQIEGEIANLSKLSGITGLHVQCNAEETVMELKADNPNLTLDLLAETLKGCGLSNQNEAALLAAPKANIAVAA